MTQSEINAHAAASGVATDATANATPAGADSRCCGDSSDCAGAESDPVAEAAVLRSQIETARDCLEAAAIAYRDAVDGESVGREISTEEALLEAVSRLEQLRKGTT